jgi:hypothetical protein
MIVILIGGSIGHLSYFLEELSLAVGGCNSLLSSARRSPTRTTTLYYNKPAFPTYFSAE